MTYLPNDSSGVVYYIGNDPFAEGQALDGSSGTLKVTDHLFDTSVADAITVPPTSWAWQNSTKLAASNTNDTLAGALFLDHGAVATVLGAGGDLPQLYQEAYLSDTTLWCCTRLFSSLTADGDDIAGLWVAPNTAEWSVLGFQWIGGDYDIVLKGGAIGGTVFNIGQAAMQAGIWLLLGVSAGRLQGYYSVAAGDDPPSTWAGWTLLDSVVSAQGGGLQKVGPGMRGALNSTLDASFYRPRTVPAVQAATEISA